MLLLACTRVAARPATLRTGRAGSFCKQAVTGSSPVGSSLPAQHRALTASPGFTAVQLTVQGSERTRACLLRFLPLTRRVGLVIRSVRVVRAVTRRR